MSLAETSNAREVYERCTTHVELLKHTKVPAVKKVAHSIRSWKSRHSLATLDQAFAEHRQSILLPKAEASSTRRPSKRVDTNVAAASAISTTSLQYPTPASPSPSAARPSPTTPSQQDPHTPPLPSPPERCEAALAHEAAPPSGQQQQQQQQQQHDDVIAGLVRDVAALRGLQLQHQTPSPLHFTSIDSRFRNDCRVLSIVGDGRCQLYSLLQVERAMLPTAYEADELRKRLKAHLLSSYTEMEWRARVPSDLREIISLQQFAERYLSHGTTHLPHDSIALWQDMVDRKADVFILNKPQRGEHVELIPCRGPAREAVVLLFTWRGVGHYELVTYNNVIALPRHHPFIVHLDELHGNYMRGLSKAVKRAARTDVKRTAAERESDVDVEGNAAAESSVLSPPTSSADQRHFGELEQKLSALRQTLEEKTADIDNLHRLNTQLMQHLRQDSDSDRLSQPADSPTTERELRHSAMFMQRYLSITVPLTPYGSGAVILPPPTNLEIPPTPVDPCCICTVETANTALSPCKHRVCQVCWTREKEELVRRYKGKRRRCRELDLPVDPFAFICPLCRQAVEDQGVEPSKRVEHSVRRDRRRGKDHRVVGHSAEETEYISSK